MEEEQMMIKMTPEEREAMRLKLKAEKEALKAQEKEILRQKFEEEKQKRKQDRDRVITLHFSRLRPEILTFRKDVKILRYAI